MWTYNYSDELYHHGVKGQKWGVRRYQNKDGTLTVAGKKRVHKNQKLIDYAKSTYGPKRYKDDAELNQKLADEMKKSGYKKWAKDNYLDEFDDIDQKAMFDEDLNTYNNKVKYAKMFMESSVDLNKKLDEIDTLAKPKEVRDSARKLVNEWLNENIKENWKIYF